MNKTTMTVSTLIYYSILMLSMNIHSPNNQLFYYLEIKMYLITTFFFFIIMICLSIQEDKIIKRVLILFFITSSIPLVITYKEEIKLEKIESYCVKDNKILFYLYSKKEVYINYTKLNKQDKKSIIKELNKNNQCYIYTRYNKEKLIFKDYTKLSNLICMPKKISKIIESKGVKK